MTCRSWGKKEGKNRGKKEDGRQKEKIQARENEIKKQGRTEKGQEGRTKDKWEEERNKEKEIMNQLIKWNPPKKGKKQKIQKEEYK